MLILEVAKKKFMNLFVCFILEFSICFVILEFWVWVPKSMLKKLHCQCNYMCRSFYFPGSMYTYANCMHIYIYIYKYGHVYSCKNKCAYICVYIFVHTYHIYTYYIHVWFSHFMLCYFLFLYIRYFTFLHVRHDAKNENITNKWLKNR